MMLGSSGFSTPFSTFYNNRPYTFQAFVKF